MNKYMKKINSNFDEFENDIEMILQYAEEMLADLPYRRPISKNEKFLLLESLILRGCALWERFLEKTLILTVSANSSKLKKAMNLKSVIKLDSTIVKAIIFSDIYRDFHDPERSKNFFSKYVVAAYNPMNNISNKKITSIQFTYSLRNYLSHYSDFSKRKLFDAYKKHYAMNRFVEPGQFLFSNKGKRFSELISNFKFTSISMRQSITREH